MLQEYRLVATVDFDHCSRGKCADCLQSQRDECSRLATIGEFHDEPFDEDE